MKAQVRYGKLSTLSFNNLGNASIIMEFADDGDVFQRICECQNNKQFMKEKHIWKIII